MKKVLAFVLVLSMILGSFGMAFAAPADVEGKDYEDAVNVLVELGVVAGYKDGTFRPENIVTRAEMATFLIKAMGLADYAVGKSDFADMAGHWADPFVAYASSLGIVAGYADGTFKPDVTVSYDQAITMVIQALGYKGEYLVGGFPGAFVNQAKALGILDGIKSGAAGANRGDVATLLYNALDEAFKRYDNEGAIQNAGGSMMDRLGAEFVDAEFVVTGEEEAVINLKEYQGALVKAWYNSDEEIIAVEVQSVVLDGEFDAEDEVFVVGDKEYKFKDNVEATFDCFVNGAQADDAELDEMMADEAAVVLAAKTSGKYITHIYSASYWEADGEFMMTEDDVEALAEDFELDGKEFAMTDDDEVDMDEVILVGVAALDKIAEDDIVTYYLGAEDLIVKVEVSNAVVEGKITKVNKDGEMIIGGKAYEVGTLLADSDAVAKTAEGKFFLNFAGEIVFAEAKTTSAEDFAIVTLANDTEEGKYGEDGVMKIKMVTEDGKEAVYVIEEDYVEELDGAVFAANTLIAYNLDKNGEIDKIEVKTTEAAVAKVTAKGFLDGYKIADGVVVFEFDGEDYTAAALKDVPVGEDLAGTVYFVNEDAEIEVIILDAEAGDDEDSVYGVVVDWMDASNEDDEDIYELTLMIDGAKKEFASTTDFELKDDAVLYEVVFDGSDVAELVEVEATAEATTVAAVKAGNIKLEGAAGYTEIASDVVIYEVDEDGNMVKAAKVEEEDVVVLYELDAEDDEDGVDVIIIL